MTIVCSAGTSINSETPSGFSDSGASGPPGFAATATIGHPQNLKERKTPTIRPQISYTRKLDSPDNEGRETASDSDFCSSPMVNNWQFFSGVTLICTIRLPYEIFKTFSISQIQLSVAVKSKTSFQKQGPLLRLIAVTSHSSYFTWRLIQVLTFIRTITIPAVVIIFKTEAKCTMSHDICPSLQTACKICRQQKDLIRLKSKFMKKISNM